jgi:hypothetical protein
MAESDINPWKRANLEQTNIETRQLIEVGEQSEYDGVLSEVQAAGIALNSLLGSIPAAQERVVLAREAQYNFFNRQRTNGAI